MGENIGENRYFQKALSDFSYEAASGGAIRHLADSGYTVRQIMERLDFPTPYERIQKAVWEHLVRQGIVLLEKPGSGGQKEKVTYVRDYDQFGKASFRRVVVREETEPVADWVVQTLGCGAGTNSMEEEPSMGDCLGLVCNKRDGNGADYAYASFDFGLIRKKNPVQYERILSVLDEHQKEYVAGLPWERQRVYHKLNARGMEVLTQLYEAGQYQGECYFLKTREIIRLNKMPKKL